VRASLVVTPRPAALLVRKVFAAGGARFAQALAKHAPPGVCVVTDERYGDDEDMLLYFKLIASHGYVVAGPRCSLAPEHRYPTPLRQLMLTFLHRQFGN
jgi:acetyl esterase